MLSYTELINAAELVNKDKSINWDKVPVDTPIKVKQSKNGKWKNMHFAKYQYGSVYAWYDGKTSWTTRNNQEMRIWEYATLPDIYMQTAYK